MYLLFHFHLPAYDIGLILLNSTFENQYGWTETIPSIFKHETYTPMFNSRLQGVDILVVGMGRYIHLKPSTIQSRTDL